MEQVEIKSYKRRTPTVHRGGRPQGDEGKGGRVKFTTTLPNTVRNELRALADLYGCPVADVISLLLLSHKTGASLDSLATLGSGDVDRKEAVQQRRREIGQMLADIGTLQLS